MVTLAPEALAWLAREWEHGIDTARARNDAATFSGIVGDAQHRAEGGYHISREDQPATNYSISDFSDDREGSSNLAAAVDMTMDREAMVMVTGRLAAAWSVRDPRLANVRAFNGTLDGVNACRWDAANDPNVTTWADSTHLWHVHLEVFRKYADDVETARNILSVILGAGNDSAEGDMQLDEQFDIPDWDKTWGGPERTSVQTALAVSQRRSFLAWRSTKDVVAKVDELTKKVDALAARPATTVDLGDGGRAALADLTAKVDRIVAALESAGAGLGKADGR
jgi:hypothetical protein